MTHGREAVAWPTDVWSSLDQAVHAEIVRTGITGRILPVRGPMPDATTVQADVIDADTMTVRDDVVLPLVELSVEFALTAVQVDAEPSLGTALTLATRASNLLAQAEDLLVFQGADVADHAIFESVNVRGAVWRGLVAEARSVIEVELDNGHAGERTVRAVARAYGELQSSGQSGPYGLVLHSEQYADAFGPLPDTLVMPADRLRPLVEGGFYGTATLPERSGLVLSLGGVAIDLVVGVEPVVAFLQVDSDGLFRFRVFERLALRVKDGRSLVRLEFAD